jgi:hypothetical protein
MLEFHPLANLFPLIEGRDFDELVADIREHGVREQIVLHEGRILDGRNRYRAAMHLGLISEAEQAVAERGLEPGWHTSRDADSRNGEGSFIGFDPARQGEPIAFVLSLNLHRRHLSESQRALIAADLGKMKQGRPSEWNKDPNRDDKPASLRDSKPELTARQRGDMLGISERQVQTGDFVKEHAAPEVADAVRRGEVKVSAAAELARLPVAEQEEILRSADPRAIARVARERQQVGGGGRATMQSRVEPDDSLDFFPTPPWATRTLIEDILMREPIKLQPDVFTVWEPACGEGHISGVLAEYFGNVVATDVFDYSAEGVSPPAWNGVLDFLDPSNGAADLVEGEDVDWIITNPPFAEQKTLEFTLRALKLAKRGVAMFVRQQWLDSGIERYERLFRDMPPTIYAQFVDRVNLCKGRWDPEGGTATAYCWLIWLKGWDRQPVLWIPPGRRVERARPDDVERFTAHPVRTSSIASVNEPLVTVANDANAGGQDANLDPGPAEVANDASAGTVAADADEVADDSGGEGGEKNALPAAFKSSEASDAIIRAGYAGDQVDLIAIGRQLLEALGLSAAPSKLQIRRRANQLGLGSRDRQRAAASAFAAQQHSRRSQAGAVDG